MKKKLSCLILILFFCFALTENVYAEDINLELKLSNISNEVVKGNYADVRVVFNTLVDSVNVDYCSFNIVSSSGFEFKEVQSLNSWTIFANNTSGNNVDIKVRSNQNSLQGMFNVLNIKYVVNEDGNVNINDATCYDISGNSIDSIANMEVLEVFAVDNTSNTMLKSLKINNEELNPNFSPNVTSYNINNFNSNNIVLEYEVSDSLYQDQVVVMVNDKLVEYSNYIPFQVEDGNNVMLITITVAEVTTYNIFVYKKLDYEIADVINSITINGVELELESNKYDYVYKVDDSVEFVEVFASLSDSENFEFSTSSNAPATFKMNDNKAIAVMNVLPKDNTKGISALTYTVTIINNDSSVVVTPNNNPSTGDTSMYVMALVIVLSLFVSVFLYQKNLNEYK